MRNSWWFQPAAVLLLPCIGCTGSIGDDADNQGSVSAFPADGDLAAPGESLVPEPGDGAGFTPLRRLTRVQYNNTVRDLLGDTSSPADDFPEDTLGQNRFTVGGVVSVVDARGYYEAAKTLGTGAVAAGLIPNCIGDAAQETTCRDGFIRDFGKRAYRRPLSVDETSDLTTLYDWARQEQAYTAQESLRVVLQAMLQSPNFLYHDEVGSRPASADAIVALTPWELASRLSYFLWSSMPDEALFAAAEANALQTAEQLQTEARRLLADERATSSLRSFHQDWLDLHQLRIAEKDPNLFPEFTDPTREAMLQEVAAFTESVFAQDGKLSTLLGANYTFVNQPLAELYGVSVSGNEFQRVTLDPNQGRAGILTQLGFLSTAAGPSTTSPIRRGKFVRERLLCQDLPPPDPDVDTSLPVPDPEVSTREQFNQHSALQECAGCHQLMDPIGFAFEHFDPIGRFREMDGGRPVDASGEIIGSANSDATFTGVQELATLLASSPDVQRCVASQWFRFASGRMESDVEVGSLEQAHGAFSASGFDLRELLVALTQTRAFTYRSAAPGELSQ